MEEKKGIPWNRACFIRIFAIKKELLKHFDKEKVKEITGNMWKSEMETYEQFLKADILDELGQNNYSAKEDFYMDTRTCIDWGYKYPVKYEDLYNDVIIIKRKLEKMLGKFKDEQILRTNWREFQYRNKLTRILGISPISSWDVIYKAVVKISDSSTNS